MHRLPIRNPHANADGTPKTGEGAQFWNYLEEKREEDLAKRSPERKNASLAKSGLQKEWIRKQDVICNCTNWFLRQFDKL